MSRGTDDNFPKARAEDLVAEHVGDELVVYDSRTSEAHCLHPLAAAVFTAADGQSSPAAIAASVSAQLGDRFEVEHIEVALAELEDRGLVSVPVASGISRRSFMQRSAAVGGVAFAGTLITSVVAPAYGMAASSGTISSNFSDLSILVLCGNTYYGMKWQNTVAGSPTACGQPGAQPGNCPWPPPGVQPSQIAPGCLSGTTATVNYDAAGNAQSVTINLDPSNSNCVVQYFAYKYGNSSSCGCGCPNNFSTPNTQKGSITIPLCGSCPPSGPTPPGP